jgi:hypothetical protein
MLIGISQVMIVFIVGFVVSVCYVLYAFIGDHGTNNKVMSVLNCIFAAVIAFFCFLTWLEYSRGK